MRSVEKWKTDFRCSHSSVEYKYPPKQLHINNRRNENLNLAKKKKKNVTKGNGRKGSEDGKGGRWCMDIGDSVKTIKKDNTLCPPCGNYILSLCVLIICALQ